jgi:hypothetical protein
LRLTALRREPTKEVPIRRCSVRRRNCGGPGGRFVSKPVATYLYPHAMGVDTHIAAPCVTR